MVDWSKLPEELLGLIVLRLFSVVEILRFRSICKSWRSSVSTPCYNPFFSRPLIHLNPLVITIVKPKQGNEQIYGLGRRAFLSRASFFRVTLSSSSSSKGWLIKYDSDVKYGTFHLLNPLSRLAFPRWFDGIDLLKVTFSEIQRGYTVQKQLNKSPAFGFKRLVLGGNRQLLGIGCDGKIRYWNGDIWTRLKDQVAQFCDIIVHQGLTYALDMEGIVWWISSSLSIYRFGPSLDDKITKSCWKDRSLVECCGEFYIVDRLLENNLGRIKARTVSSTYSSVIHDDVGNAICELPGRYYYPKTASFKVYKVDEELEKWVQVKSLGDNAFMMATDTCFSVSAHEFNGCLQNAIYFSEEDEYEINVFKLEDGSITTMSGYSQSCFQMFVPNFT